MNCGEILKQWLAAINGHDVLALTALMAVDHVFVDSLGNRVNGAKWSIDRPLLLKRMFHRLK